MKRIIIILSLILTSVISGVTFGSIFEINPFIPAVSSLVLSFVPLPGGSLYGLVATSPAVAAAYQFQLPYIPQFLIWDAGGAPLTNLRVEEAQLGVICDLPAAGILQVRDYRRFGLVASTVTKIRLANGHIKNKNLTITAVIAAAAAVPFQACSDCPGDTPFKYNIAGLLAGAPQEFKKFIALFLPGLAPGDTVLVEFANGHTQLFNEVELLEFSALWQNNQLATGFHVNNIDSYIHKATVTQAIAGPVYIYSALL